MWYLRLALPRSSKFPELVQILRDHTFQSSSPYDWLQKEREETTIACLKYIERCEASDSDFNTTVPKLEQRQCETSDSRSLADKNRGIDKRFHQSYLLHRGVVDIVPD